MKSDDQNNDKYRVDANITKYQMRGVDAVICKKFCVTAFIREF